MTRRSSWSRLSPHCRDTARISGLVTARASRPDFFQSSHCRPIAGLWDDGFWGVSISGCGRAVSWCPGVELNHRHRDFQSSALGFWIFLENSQSIEIAATFQFSYRLRASVDPEQMMYFCARLHRKYTAEIDRVEQAKSARGNLEVHVFRNRKGVIDLNAKT